MASKHVEIDNTIFIMANRGEGAAIDAINKILKQAKLPLYWAGNGPKNWFDVTAETNPGTVEVTFPPAGGSFVRVTYTPAPKKKAKPEVDSVDKIVTALRSAFYKDTKQWILIEELRMGSGYGTGSERTIDLWALNTYPSKKHVSVSYEIKRSRSDFLVDVKVGFRKHRAALAYSDEFYYVAPAGIIKEEDLPPWAGLIEIIDGKAKKKHRPIAGDRMRPSWGLICSILRRKDRIIGG